MASVNAIYEVLAKFAPPERKMDFDNVGFLVGRAETEVTRALIALDITDEVIEEAKRLKAQLVVSHHPLFFSLKSVNNTGRTGRKIVELISNGISAICMHTNLDAADGGVNDALARAVGIADPELLAVEGVDPADVEYSCGRVGYLKNPIAMADFLPELKSKLNASGLRYWDSGRPVHKVAVVGGSGGSMIEDVLAKNCDTFVTADIKYDVFLEAKEAGLNLIDGDHFCTENLVTSVLLRVITEAFPDIEASISKVHGQTAKFM